jgi:hypothetical protein
MTPLLLTLPAQLNGFAQLSATAAVAGLWQGIALAAAAALALRLVPRTTATGRFFLWTAVLLGAALLPVVHLPGSAHAAASQAQTASLLHVGRGWSLGIAALWLALSVLRLAQLAVQGIRLRALWRNAQPTPAAPEIASLLETVPLRRVELCLSAEVDRPSVIGFFSPRILIPDWLFGQLTAPELFQIVLHEAEHLRRGDDWLNLVQKLSLALFPLNPALVWIERRLCSERELACDDGVLRVTLAPRVYATCLATLAERRLEYRAGHLSALSLALGALGALGTGAVQTLGRSELSRRVYSILHRPPSLSPARSRAVTAMLAVGLAGCAAELARSPQLVSFTAPPATLQTATSTSPAPPASRPWEPAGNPTGLSAAPGYENVGFHSPNARARRADAAAQPRMTLLKATMPIASSWPDAAASHTAQRMIPTSAKSAPLRVPVARHSASQRLAESFLVMTSWTTGTATGTATETMTETITESPADATTSQRGEEANSTRPGITRMTVLVDRMPERTPSPTAAPARDKGVNPTRKQLQAQSRDQAEQVSPQYAAVPTDLGWVIVEL